MKKNDEISPDYYVYSVDRQGLQEDWLRAGKAYIDEDEDTIRIELGYGVVKIGGEIILTKEYLQTDLENLPVCHTTERDPLKLVIDN